MSKEKSTNSKSITYLQNKRGKLPTVDELYHGIIKGNKVALARAITLVENTHIENVKKADAIIEKCLTQNPNSIRIGITGIPGVGKSTFIESFGKKLTALEKKVAVLSIDPSSSQTKGSILGDKTRMHQLAKDPNAFIRPSPSGISLGGVSRKTRESIILCEAAGYNIILIETVGVGQSETAVHSMVDFFLLLKLPNTGDELQGIKRGIIEMADAIIINKADGDTLNKAELTKVEFTQALKLYSAKKNGWSPKVMCCSAIENKGIEDVIKMIFSYVTENKKSNFFQQKRKEQNKNWLLQTLEDQLKVQFYEDKAVKVKLNSIIEEVINLNISPFKAAEKLLLLRKN